MPTALLVLPSGAAGGNRTTALRWARILRGEGWRVGRASDRNTLRADLLVALHARRSRAQVVRLSPSHPGAPLIVAATGTDLYVDLPAGGEHAREVREGFAAADRIVVLQERALARLPADLRARARVVVQSTPALDDVPAPEEGTFEVLLVASLRAVKDPMLPARAARAARAGSKLEVVHLGEALDDDLAAAALREMDRNPRYRWLGSRPRRETLCRLARARLLVCPSLQEGGANVLTEAFAQGTPVLASAVDGNLGLVGEDHPGLFPPGDARALAALLTRAEEDARFLGALAARSRARAWMADPAREREAWRALLAELFPGGAP